MSFVNFLCSFSQSIYSQEATFKISFSQSSDLINWENFCILSPNEVLKTSLSALSFKSIACYRCNQLRMADKCNLLITFDWIFGKEVSEHLLDVLTSLIDLIFRLESAFRQLIDHHVEHDFFDVGVGGPAFKLAQLLVEDVFLSLFSESVYVPQLWSLHGHDS